jgi:hypothetical protein
MADLDLALRLGAALGLGLLLGFERERKHDAELLFGGVRTFALIALLGAIGAFAERALDQGWLLLAAFVAVVALVLVSYAITAARGEMGITTEITALLAFIVGALCTWDKVGVAAVVTGSLPAAAYPEGLPASSGATHGDRRRGGDPEVRRNQRRHSPAPAESDVRTAACGCHQSLSDLADGRFDRGARFPGLRAGQSARQ